ncbi:tyrosyl-tRNA synthetase [Afifella sp. IM 167]|uniref:tyrosyl-tRNA synthetase n=1 Tax=Afifella sp. IM 167 TaxID=2033586 RepID=UPI001CC9D195|nr:tyrosyl-tRNA synthetase [Afifella sp. IM 167]
MFKKIAVTTLAVATLATASVSATTGSAQAGGKGLALGIIAGATALGVGAAIAHGHGPYYGHPVYGYCEFRKVRVWSPYKGHYVWRTRKICY